MQTALLFHSKSDKIGKEKQFMLKCEALNVEYRTNPLGLDEAAPRFSWKLVSDQNSVRQTAYRIIVDGMWDSGRVEAETSVHIVYGGKPLKPKTRYTYRIKVWDNHGEESEQSEGFFETGFLGHTDLWRAKWLEPQTDGDAVPVLSKKFCIEKKPDRARLYATAYGVYEVYINGKRVSDSYLAPGFTSYSKRLQYQTYEAEQYLVCGENEIEIFVSKGWYNGRFRSMHGVKPCPEANAVLAQLEVWNDKDKESVAAATDESWKCCESKLRFCEIYDGEIYDNGFAEDISVPIKAGMYGYDNLIGQICEPVRAFKTLAPKEVIRTPKGETVLDFGQNLVGWVSFKVSGNRDDRAELSHAEVLDCDGNFYTDNLRSAQQKVVYILNGETEETYHSRMTFQGFRYVRIDAYPGEVSIPNFTAYAISTEMERTGNFKTSLPLLNRLYENVLWGQWDNFVDIPTDCPQRDERLGWTGDAQVFCRTAVQNMNAAMFFEKWLGDLAADQTDSGLCPKFIPSMGNAETSAGWGDAAVICPWEVYFAYDDIRLLERQYPSMTAWVEYIKAQGTNPYLWDSGFQYGDWLALDAPGESMEGGTSKAYIASAFYAKSAELLAKSAEVLGKKEDAEKYRKLSKDIIAEIRRTFTAPDGCLEDQTQTAYAIALEFGLCSDSKTSARRLYDLVCGNGNKLTTGFLGTPYLCDALSENGYSEKAFDLLLREEYPSWLYSVKNGATTIWEHWDGIRTDGTFWSESMNSFNHYAYGAVASFMYRKIGGIVPLEPGYKRIGIYPIPDSRIKFAETSIDTVYGLAETKWRLDGNEFNITVTVPCNTAAEIRLPDGTLHYMGSGNRSFSCTVTDNGLD